MGEPHSGEMEGARKRSRRLVPAADQAQRRRLRGWRRRACSQVSAATSCCWLRRPRRRARCSTACCPWRAPLSRTRHAREILRRAGGEDLQRRLFAHHCSQEWQPPDEIWAALNDLQPGMFALVHPAVFILYVWLYAGEALTKLSGGTCRCPKRSQRRRRRTAPSASCPLRPPPGPPALRHR